MNFKLFPYRLSLFIFIIFACIHLFSQQTSIKFNTFEIEDGLSQSHATDIIQDNFGYIWIATQDGLNRFNGYEFKIYKNNPSDSNSIPNNYIHCLKKDEEGNLWFGTNRGIGKINPSSLKIEKINRNNYPDLKGYIFLQIDFDKNGKLWALSEKYGINIIDINTKKIEVISVINGQTNFSSLIFDDKQTLWVGTENGNVFYASAPYKSFKKINYDLGNSTIGKVNKFYYNDSLNIIVCSENGVYTIDKEFKTKYLSSYNELRYQNITSIFIEENNKIWLGSKEYGLYLLKTSLDEPKTSLFHYTKNPFNQYSLSDNGIQCLYNDLSGNIWIGTENGVSKFDRFKQGFTSVTISDNPEKGLIDRSVWSFNEDLRGNVFIGTKKGLTIYNEKTNRFKHLNRDNLNQHYLMSIYVENPNKLWLGFEDGLFILNIKSTTDYSFKKIDFLNKDDNSLRIYQIVEADEERLWIGSKDGLSIINKNTLSYEFYQHEPEDENSIGDGAVKVIYRDLAGKIWIVTSNHGLYNLIEKSDQTFYFKKYEVQGYDETNGHITSILQIDNEYLWLGTYGEGLKKINLKTKDVKTYTELDGLSNNVIYGLLSDEENNIWVSTNKGLSKLNVVKETFKNYSTVDGIPSNEFNTNSYFKSSNNELYFGGINGYTKFKASEIKINPTPPKVVISSITTHSKDKNNNVKKLLSKNITDSLNLVLPYFQNDLTFEFFSVHYSNAQKNSFKYILEGYEDEYTTLNNENKVSYMNLPSGDYTFKIFSKSPDGIWSTEACIVSIEINPPYWLTWWFISLSILFLGGIIFLINRSRNDRIRRQKVKLELEVVKRTRKISEQNNKIKEQSKQVEIQKIKIEQQKELLQKEKEKVESILLNILPEGTASELINKGKSKARYYKKVTVMFTDFVGFSKIAEDMTPHDLVNQLDNYFTQFDEIIGKHDIEKIKTIGDSYMCAGGVPIRNKSNAIEVVLAALEIQDFMRDKQEKEGDACWKIRIGINTGEITAGVIGQKRFAYDIWGSTVNQAQRMEMHGEPGEVNVSGNTYEIIAPYFSCTYRGKIQTKHNGMLDMYFINGIKPELSENGEGRFPNKKFWQIVDLHLYSSINYMKAERHIMKLLEERLSPNLHYHSINHTKDVTEAVERLALMEGITDEDLFILKSAATYHDAGFIEKYDKNEEIGMRLAREILPKYGYTQKQIDMIDNLIKATEIPHTPNNLMEQIMCDADLDYLGRDDFHDIASLLKRELREHGKINSDRLWDEIQVKFLTQHKYFTKSAIDTREAKKMKHLDEIKEKLKTYNYTD